VGKRFTYVGTAASQAGRAPQWVTVVGVVGDLRYEAPAKTPLAEMYYPYSQQSFGGPLVAPLVAVKVTSDAARFGPALRAAVRGLDAGVTVSQERTMERIVAQALATERLSTSVLGAFALIALVLAAAGIYGVMAFTVARRTREIGVRMALGAEPRAVLSMVLRGALALALAGVGLGLAGAAALTRVMASLLYGVSATDPAIFAAVVALVLAVSALAAYVPARRAARVDPMVALRYE
jgi:putative ABC transport system permease protein